jgi:multiple sugar transport system ATP-binding protein
VFQQYSLYPHLSVFENLAFPLRSPARRMAEDQIRRRVDEVARMVRIHHKLSNRATRLSGGEMQRVAIGRALVRRPAIYLMDEPLSSLDAKLRGELRLELKRIQAELGATVLYVTHDQIEAMTLADRIVAMHAGVVQQVGTPLDLYDRPANLFVAGFIGSPGMNFFEGRYLVSGDQADLRLANGATLSAPRRRGIESGAAATLGIRPEHVVLNARGALEAKVDLIEPTGFGIIMHVTIHDVPMKIFTLDRTMLDPGPTVRVDLPQERLHLFGTEGRRMD